MACVHTYTFIHMHKINNFFKRPKTKVEFQGLTLSYSSKEQNKYFKNVNRYLAWAELRQFMSHMAEKDILSKRNTSRMEVGETMLISNNPK